MFEASKCVCIIQPDNFVLVNQTRPDQSGHTILVEFQTPSRGPFYIVRSCCMTDVSKTNGFNVLLTLDDIVAVAVLISQTDCYGGEQESIHLICVVV